MTASALATLATGILMLVWLTAISFACALAAYVWLARAEKLRKRMKAERIAQQVSAAVEPRDLPNTTAIGGHIIPFRPRLVSVKPTGGAA